MMIARISILVAYATMSAFGLYFLKRAPNLISGDTLIGGLLYGAGFVIWIVILRLLPLSVAFPVAAGSLIIVTQLIGALLLKETWDFINALGVSLVFLGIVFIYTRG
jgi:multidrug transporter EmrE-like cation transporter